MIAYMVLKLHKEINIESEKDKEFIKRAFPDRNPHISEKYPEGYIGTIKLDNENITGIAWVYKDIESALTNSEGSSLIEIEVDENTLDIVEFGDVV